MTNNTVMSEEQLLPCPFCGGEAMWMRKKSKLGMACKVQCSDECCAIERGCWYCDDACGRKRAAEIWNTRATPNNTAASDLVERVARAMFDACQLRRFAHSPYRRHTWDSVGRELREEWIEHAHAAIAALPTVDAGQWEPKDQGHLCQTGSDLVCKAPDDWCDRHCPVRNGFERPAKFTSAPVPSAEIKALRAQLSAQAGEIARLREALQLADAALSGANMNMNVVERKVKTELNSGKADL